MQKVKTVKFNLSKLEDRILYRYATSTGNFAGFVKELIKKEQRRSRPVYKANSEGVIKIHF